MVWVFSLSLVYAQSDVPSLTGNDQPSPAPTGLSTYRLAAGDVITIRVLGEVKVLGLTTGDLERIVTSGLKGRYLVNPKVSVQIEEYRPFYINGMVDKPGGYPYQPGLTIRKAASLAGGFKERASVNKISIIRDGDPSQRSQRAELNTFVMPGDIVTVDESFF